MPRRLHKTLFDYVVIAISPALIMLLVGSFVFFLLDVFYHDQHLGRLQWIFAMFVMGTVCIARLSIEEGKEYAAMFAAPLAIVAMIAMMRFVDWNGWAAFSWLMNLALLATVWWSAHKLTWDCTVIDESQDASGEGLLQHVGFEEEGGDVSETGGARPDANGAARAPKGEQPEAGEPDGTTSRDDEILRPWWQQLVADRRPHTPGVWVLYCSLAALPIFGLGQHWIPATDVALRRHAFQMLFIFVGSALGLLLTTSFLGLRRYLRQRKIEMPAEMAGLWLGVGAAMIAVVLLFCMLLPRPNAEYAVSQVPVSLAAPEGLRPSRYSVGDDGVESDSNQDARAVADADQSDSSSSAESQSERQSNAGSQGRGSQSQSSQGQQDQRAQGQSSQGQSSQGQSSQGQSSQGQKSQSRNSQARESQNSSAQNGSSQSQRAPRQRAQAERARPQKSDQPDQRSQADSQQSNSQQSTSQQADSQQQRDSAGDRQSPEAQRRGGEEPQAGSSDSRSQQPPRQPSQRPGDARAQDGDAPRQRAERREQQAAQRPRDDSERRSTMTSKSRREREGGTPERRSSGGSASRVSATQILSNVGSALGTVLKLIFYALLAGILGYLLWKYWEQVKDAVQQFWAALQDFWQRLFGGREAVAEDEAGGEAASRAVVTRRFSEFADPFLTGLAERYTAQELVRYSFEALEAWGREQNCVRGVEETAVEYARRVAADDAELRRETRYLAELYGHAAYARRELSGRGVRRLEKLWQQLRGRASTGSSPPAVKA